MKQSGTGKTLSVIFLGMLFGAYRHFDQMRWLSRGREAYLAEQSHRFDRIVQYHSAPTMLVAGVIVAAVVVGLYELAAAGFTHFLKPSALEE